jgi:hypothetical protein
MTNVSTRSTSRKDASTPSRRLDLRSRDSWTRPLRRMRRAIDSSVRLLDACHSLVISSRRCAAPRPIRATNQLMRVSNWLVEAAKQLARAGRGLNDTLDSIGWAPEHVVERAPGRVIDATARWIDAANRLARLSSRVDADFAWLREWVTSLEFLNLPAPASDWLRSRFTSRRVDLRRSRRLFAQPASDAVRSLHRGRAPPRLELPPL